MNGYNVNYDEGPYSAIPDDTRVDGTWKVWSVPYHYGIGMSKSAAIKRAKKLNKESKVG